MSKGGSAPPPDPRIAEAALMQGKLGEEWLQFAREAFKISQGRQSELDALTKKITTFQLGEMQRLGNISKQDRARYLSVFRPLENQFIKEAKNYDTPEKQAEAAAKATADVSSAAARERQSSEREMASMGVNPGSGRYAGLDRALGLGTGLAKVGAANNAREDVRNTGRMLRAAAVDMGRGLPASAAAASQLASGTGSSAAGVAGGAEGAYQGSLGIMNQGFQGGIAGYGAQGAGLNNYYNSQLNAWQAQQQQNNANMGGWGQILGTGLGLGLSYFSSKKLKTGRKAVQEGDALDTVKNLPVESFRYKEGLDDGSKHVGPMAEDFAKATGSGDGKTIKVQDAIGLTLGAVKDLAKRVDRIDKAVGLGLRMRRAA